MNGHYSLLCCINREEGTPQGGNLSPLLSNIVLDELDQELERRGHQFCRYADDCNIYVKSWEAGRRVMKTVKQAMSIEWFNKMKLINLEQQMKQVIL